MKNITILLLMIIISGCSKSNQKSTSTTPPPSTSSTPTNVAAVCGNWIEDSVSVWQVTATSFTTADTTWYSAMHYSNPANYYLNLSSSTYTLTTSTNIVVGYKCGGTSPPTTFSPGVWKMIGDTIYFPGDNNPVNQELFYGIEKLTSHELMFTTRAYCTYKLGSAMGSFNKYYFHK